MTVVVGLLVPFGLLLVQALRGGRLRVGITAAAALVINVAMFFKRLLLVVPAQYQTHLPMPRTPHIYSPSYAEIVIVIGSYAFAALSFVIALKLIPVVELPSATAATPVINRGRRTAPRRVTLLMSLIVGLSLILWGVVERDADFAPAKWIAGLMFLVALPLENCLIRDRHAGGGAVPDEELL